MRIGEFLKKYNEINECRSGSISIDQKREIQSPSGSLPPGENYANESFSLKIGCKNSILILGK
jgi:hypothetical protein